MAYSDICLGMAKPAFRIVGVLVELKDRAFLSLPRPLWKLFLKISFSLLANQCIMQILNETNSMH